MTGLTSLERAALMAVLDELGDESDAIKEPLLGASALSRENTGGGFFTKLSMNGALPDDLQGKHLGDNVWVAVEGMSLGLGIILHLWKDEVPLLGGYAVASENTSLIDFGQVRFAVAAAPSCYRSTADNHA